MKKGKRKEIQIMVLTAVVTAALTLTAGIAVAFSGTVGSEYEIYDSGKIVYGPGDGGYSNSKKTDLDDGLGDRYSYCIQPDKDTPVVTKVRIAKVIEKESSQGEWGALRRILFFSPSYPGYMDNKNGVMQAFYTGNFSEDWGIAHLAMSYIFAGRPADLDTYRFTKASELGDIWTKAKKLGDEMMKSGTAWETCIPNNFRVFISGTEGYQSMAVGSMEVPGNAVIKKKSSMNEITSGNDSYNLKGAEYTLVGEKTGEVIRVNLDERGESGPVSLRPGKYTVFETAAPEGYAKDVTKRTVTVSSGASSVLEISDTPITATPEVILKKSPEGFDRDHGEGDGTLKGAVYCFEYMGKSAEEGRDPIRTWYFETDEKGEISGRNPKTAEGYRSDSLYANGDGETVFPLGKYRVREIKPSEGYLSDDNICLMEISEDGTDLEYTKAVSPAASSEKIVRGGVRIVKADADLGKERPQGDGKLSGAEFSIINRSKEAISFDGRIAESGDTVAVLVTKENGIGEIPGNVLPYGTYSVTETKAPEGYLLNGSWEKTFSIRKDGEVIDLSAECADDAVMRSGLQAVKLDGELMRSETMGGASFEGVKVTIRNRSENPVLVRASFEDEDVEVDWSDTKIVKELLDEGKLREVGPGEDIAELSIKWNEEKKAYTAQTKDRDLPYGTYGIRETETSGSYQRTDRTEHIVELRSDGELISYDGGNEDKLSFINRVYRSDIEGTKIKDSTSERLSFVPFKITSLSNGETHVIVTDRNGYFFSGDRRTADELTENEKKDNARKINPFDDLIEKEKILNEEILKREDDIRMGVWFGTGERGSAAQPVEKTGALPYDTYLIEEMPCENNEGCTLQKFRFTVDEKSLSGRVDLATVTDDEKPVVNREKPQEKPKDKEKPKEKEKEKVTKKKEVPKTGDTSGIFMWSLMFAVASAAFIYVKEKTKKTRL